MASFYHSEKSLSKQHINAIVLIETESEYEYWFLESPEQDLLTDYIEPKLIEFKIVNVTEDNFVLLRNNSDCSSFVIPNNHLKYGFTLEYRDMIMDYEKREMNRE